MKNKILYVGLFLCAFFWSIPNAFSAQEITVTHSTAGNMANEITAALQSASTSAAEVISLIVTTSQNAIVNYADCRAIVDGLVNLESLDLQSALFADNKIPNAQGNYLGAFASAGKLKNVFLPKTIVEVGTYAFKDCSNLTAIDLPQVTLIGDNAFELCKSLTSVNIPKAGLLSKAVFLNCESLTSIDLPVAKQIRNSVFNGCKNLTDVFFAPDSIGNEAFNSCTKLQTITCNNSTPPKTGQNVFIGVLLSEIDLYVPYGMSAKYKAAAPWNGMAIFESFPGEGRGTQTNPFQITNAMQLDYIRYYLDNSNIYFVLKNDIDVKEFIAGNANGWLPIGNDTSYFEGNLQGDKHIVTNLVINRSTMSDVGLFSALGSEAVIENLGISKCHIVGKNRVGSIAGKLDGWVKACYATGLVSGKDTVGGLVGYSYGGTFTNTYSTAVVEGGFYVGGLVGISDFEITNSYAAGIVRTINPEQNITIGGLFGLSKGTVNESFYDATVSGQTDNLGKGKTTDEMHQTITFQGWDFENVWKILPNTTYPFYSWQSTPAGINRHNVNTVTGAYYVARAQLDSIQVYVNDVSEAKNYLGLVTINADSTWSYTFAKQMQQGDAVHLIAYEKEKAPSLDITTFLQSVDASLKMLSVSGELLNSAFMPSNTQYTLNVDNSVTSITIAAEANNSKATVSGDVGQKTLAEGVQTFLIQVTAEDILTQQTYEIKVKRQAIDEVLSSDSTLSGIAVNNKPLEDFVPESEIYSLTVPFSIKTATILATPNFEFAKVEGDVYDSTLVVGANTFFIRVTAENGSSQKQYSLTITRQANNDAALVALAISSGTLNPTFTPNTIAYTATVEDSVVTVTATTADSNATVTGTGIHKLAVGNNTLNIVVTAQDQSTTKTYTIVINRPLGIEEVRKEIRYSLYPNPAREYITIQGITQKTSLKIYNLQGKLLIQKTVFPENQGNQLSVQELDKGIYFIKIGENVLKFVKQ